MDELERRLRSALTEMAEEVPPSHDAWAEQERRLAASSRRSRRRPALMVAAAAAVVAMIVIPVLVFRAQPSSVDEASAPPPTATTGPASDSQLPPTGNTPEYRPLPGEAIVTLPAPINTTKENLTTYVYTVARDKQQFMCFADVPLTRNVVIEGSKRSSCVGLNPPKLGKYVWLQYAVPAQKDTGLYIYVASSPTDNILIRREEGGYTSAYKLTTGKDFSLFVSYLNSPKPPAAWTARDKANAALENGG